MVEALCFLARGKHGQSQMFGSCAVGCQTTHAVVELDAARAGVLQVKSAGPLLVCTVYRESRIRMLQDTKSSERLLCL